MNEHPNRIIYINIAGGYVVMTYKQKIIHKCNVQFMSYHLFFNIIIIISIHPLSNSLLTHTGIIIYSPILSPLSFTFNSTNTSNFHIFSVPTLVRNNFSSNIININYNRTLFFIFTTIRWISSFPYTFTF